MEQNTGMLVRNWSPEANFWTLLTRAESSSILKAEVITPPGAVHENLQSEVTCGNQEQKNLQKNRFEQFLF